MRAKVRPLEWVVIVFVTLILGAILWPVTATSGPGSHRSPCLSNLKQSSLAMMIYTGDYDDRFPYRDEWTDVLYPYAKTWAIFHCPKAQGTAWGYAMNGSLSRTDGKKLGSPETTPMLYDSVNPIKNASDRVASLPAVPRHERNNMGYADGHVKAMIAPQATQ